MEKRLTAKEKRFCKEWAAGQTPVEAYRIAKFPLDESGEVPSSALGEMLKNPNIYEYVDFLKKEEDNTFGLTKKQQRFCEEYVANGFKSASSAYMKAFNSKNANAAAVEANRLLNNLSVKKYIAKISEPLTENALVKAEDIIEEYKLIAFSDIRQTIDIKDGEIFIKNIEELPPEVTRTILEISSANNKMGRSCKVKLHDKIRALDSLAKFSGLSSDLNEAFAVLRKYGYEAEKTDNGYALIDTFNKDK